MSYTSQSASGYNVTPPSDDATESEANKVKWSTIKEKLGDPAKTLADNINTANVNAWADLASTTSADEGDALIGVKRTETGAVADTLHDWIQYSTVRVTDFGDNTTPGTTDMTAAIQAAIDSFGSGNGRIIFPAGTYLVTSTITIAQDRIHLVGEGMYATQITFTPTANDTCFSVTKGASVIYQGSIRDMAFYSDDSTYEKIAIDISDHSGYQVENIAVGGGVAVSGASLWSGGAGGSTALSLKGREFGIFNNLYIAADLPITINDNPNSTIDIDHHSFTDLYLTGNITQPLITVADGVNLTSVTFSGAQAWVRGSYGLYWNDTTTTGVSQGLTLNNVRTEQGAVATDYSIYISHNQTLQSLAINEMLVDSARKGMYLRNVDNVAFTGLLCPGTNELLNVDSTVNVIEITNCFWQAGSSATMTNQRLLYSSPKNPSSGALPPFAVYETDTSEVARNLTLGGAIGQESITLANDGTATLGQNTMGGILIITDSEYASAIFAIRGTGNAVTELDDVSSIYSASAGTSSSTNIYWSAGNSRYEIENKRGGDRTYRFAFIGTYSSGF